MSVYDQVPNDIFQSIVPGAGVIMTQFDPAAGTVDRTKIVASTNGGINFQDQIAFKDYAEGIDNLPRNTKEFKRVDNSQRSITLSGTAKSANDALVKKLMAAADAAGNKLTPRAELAQSDFYDLWVVMNYSNINTGENAGRIAIKLKNVLHTGGFKIQTKNDDLADFAFEFTAHYSANAIDDVPYEVYIYKGGDPIPRVLLNAHYGEVTVGSTLSFSAATVPSDATVTWSSSDSTTASVSSGTVSGLEAGSVIITASITEDGVTYNDTATVVVKAAS